MNATSVLSSENAMLAGCCVLLVLMLAAAHEALRRGGPWPGVLAFLVLPPLALWHWVVTNPFELFGWVKFISVLLCSAWITCLRFTSLGEQARWRNTMPLLLAINIAEAATLDIFHGNILQVVNAALLIATLPWGVAAVEVRHKTKARELWVTGISRAWMVAFVVWNWVFLYQNHPFVAGQHILVLGLTLAVGWLEPRRFLQARFFILGVDLAFHASFRARVDAVLDSSGWYKAVSSDVAAWVALVVTVAALILEKRHEMRVNAAAFGAPVGGT